MRAFVLVTLLVLNAIFGTINLVNATTSGEWFSAFAGGLAFVAVGALFVALLSES